ncbi:MAG: helix-turn-helix domain-containing protein [Vicinamibacteria bacterium]
MIRLKAERLARGWSQRDLARRVGLYPSDVSRVENGRGTAYPGHIEKIAKVLDVPLKRALEEVETELRILA